MGVSKTNRIIAAVRNENELLNAVKSNVNIIFHLAPDLHTIKNAGVGGVKTNCFTPSFNLTAYRFFGIILENTFSQGDAHELFPDGIKKIKKCLFFSHVFAICGNRDY